MVEDPFEGFVAGVGALEVADLAGLFEDGGQACRCGELVARRETVDAAGDGEELRGEGAPHAGQAADEGRVRVAVEGCLNTLVEIAEASLGGASAAMSRTSSAATASPGTLIR